MDPFTIAIPVFLITMWLEYRYGLRHKLNTYDLADSINSLSTGVIMLIVYFFYKGGQFALYLYLYSQWHLLDSPTSTLGWCLFAIAFFFWVDFTYYWFHRWAHEINVLWGSHEPHHQSEHFNLSTALRQGAFQGLFSFPLYLPLAIVGCPPVLYAALSSANTLYQYWIHTEHLGRLGWFEKWFVTPSHHRVHHGRNPEYIDKNHGGTLILWDKLFGTFQEEQQRPLYGITKSLDSWNPIWANFHWWSHLWKAAKHTRRWQDKGLIWFKRTGWLPKDVSYLGLAPDPLENPRPDPRPILSTRQRLYCGGQFLLMLAVSIVFLSCASQWPIAGSVLIASMLLIGFWNIGRLLEGKTGAKLVEIIRLPSTFIFFVMVMSQ